MCRQKPAVVTWPNPSCWAATCSYIAEKLNVRLELRAPCWFHDWFEAAKVSRPYSRSHRASLRLSDQLNQRGIRRSLQMEDEHSSLFLSQGLRVLAKSNNDAHLKSSCHMGNVYKSFYNPVGM